MILLIICAALFIGYAILVIYYWWAWKSVPVFEPGSATPATRISVIIPARNEEEHIGRLLTALQEQSYPAHLFEVIVVDDHSGDRTPEIAREFPAVKLVSLQENNINSYKKKAVETGVGHATGEMIVATDADCLPGPGWLTTIAAFAVERKAVFVAAPVRIDCNNSVLEIFQALDFMILQAITGAVVYRKQLSMCNGANLAYTKEAFVKAGGFAGIDTIASGDDMLLMHKIWKQHPEGVHYLQSKEAIVNTVPQRTWRAFFSQRIRWASKAAHYEDKGFFPVLLLVYLFNLGFLALLIAALLYSFYWKWLFVLWAAKTIVELPLFIAAADFYNKRWAIKFFFFFQPLHILYTIMAGLFGQFGKYEWKGRRVK